MRMTVAAWACLALYIAIMAVLLTACAGMPQEHVTTVNVPVSVPCRSRIAESTFVDSLEALRKAPGIDVRVNLLLAGRIQRDRLIDQLKASVSGCVFAD